MPKNKVPMKLISNRAMKALYQLKIISILVLIVHVAKAQTIPPKMTFQGILTNTAGEPVSDGPYNFTFNIFNTSTGGSTLWSETHTAVTVNNGLYTVILGEGDTPSALTDLDFDEEYFLDVTVGGETLSPRVPITSTSYILNKHVIDLSDGILSGSKVGTGVNASNITSGTLSTARIPNLDATKITSGTINNLRLDADLKDLADGSLSGSKVGTGINAVNITSGTLSSARVPNLDATKITSGTINNLRLDSDLQDLADGSLSGSKVGTGINAVNISSGTLGVARIPSLDAAKITTGVFNNSRLDIDLQDLADGTLSDSRLEAIIDRTGFNATGDISAGGKLDVAGATTIGSLTFPSSKFVVQGTTNDNSAFAMTLFDNAGTALLAVRNDGVVQSEGNLSILGSSSLEGGVSVSEGATITGEGTDNSTSAITVSNADDVMLMDLKDDGQLIVKGTGNGSTTSTFKAITNGVELLNARDDSQLLFYNGNFRMSNAFFGPEVGGTIFGSTTHPWEGAHINNIKMGGSVQNARLAIKGASSGTATFITKFDNTSGDVLFSVNDAGHSNFYTDISQIALTVTSNYAGSLIKYGVRSVLNSAGSSSRYGFYSDVDASNSSSNGTYGYYANMNHMGGSGHIYGFYANMAGVSGTGREYGFYVTGAEMNYLNSPLGIGDTTPDASLDVVGDIHYTGSLTPISDERLKKNVADLNQSLMRITGVRGVSYELIDSTMSQQKIHFGVLAQELEKIFPELVSENEDGYKQVNYMGLIAPLIEALKEQQDIIDTQSKLISKQTDTNNQQETRLKALEDQLSSILKRDYKVSGGVNTSSRTDK